MPKETKMIDEELVNEAIKALDKLGHNGIVAIRLKAIVAAYKHGIKTVSEVYDIHRSSLHRWVSLFKKGQIDAIQNAKKPSRSKLSQEQQRVVKVWIDKDCTLTIKKLGMMIEEEFSLLLSKSSIHRMILNLGFSHITGRKRHYKSDKSAQIEFKKKSIPENSKES